MKQNAKFSFSEWVSEWVSEWTTEWMNKMNEWTREAVGKATAVRSPCNIFNQKPNLHLNWELRTSCLHLVTGVIAWKLKFIHGLFWTFVSILKLEMSLLFENLATSIIFLLFWPLCTCSCQGKAIPATKLQDPWSASKDLCCTIYQSTIPIRSWDSAICDWLLGWLLQNQILKFGFFCTSVSYSDTHKINVVWKFCKQNTTNFLLFDPFVLVVAVEKLPQQPNCKIHKLLPKNFHMKQMSMLSFLIVSFDIACC